METSIRKASSITTISKSMKTSISMSSIRISSIGIRISSSNSNWGSSKRSWYWDFMDRGSSLQGSKTSSSSIIKRSLESSLGSSNLFSICKIISSNLSSLGISIHGSKSCMFSSFSSSESSIKVSLGSSNLVNISKIFSSNPSSLSISIHWSKSSMFSSFSSSKSSCVLNWEGSGGKSQKGSNDQFIHVCA